MVGFSVFSWNLERSLYLAPELKRRRPGITILAGGPEITPDNALAADDAFDIRICGDGEAVFRRLLTEPMPGPGAVLSEPAGRLFTGAASPYAAGLLEPELEDLVLLETQRGCPYHCGFCYYNKSRDRLSVVPDETVLAGMDWAVRRGVSELFLLDPSLNARPGLKRLLREMTRRYPDRLLSIESEIRAEAVDAELADLFAAAGFTEFEIGLQTITPEALAVMRRPTDRKRFLEGARLLSAAGVRAKIDLMIGLPGDTPDGFRRSVDFVAENGLADDVQVFHLAVLPGTAFRAEARSLGLTYQDRPPYTILRTPTFTSEDMLSCFVYAEDTFDLSLQPQPDLDLSWLDAGSGALRWKKGGVHDHEGEGDDGLERAGGAWLVTCRTPGPGPDGRPAVRKVLLGGADSDGLSSRLLEDIAGRLTHPYQVMLRPDLTDLESARRALAAFTAANPHTPLEIVMTHPRFAAPSVGLEEALALDRPLYLDRDLPALGSRSVLWTLALAERSPVHGGVMKRQIFHWKKPDPPTRSDLEELFHLDGILIDGPDPGLLARWQDDMGPEADLLPALTFSHPRLQRRWWEWVSPADYLP